jgi:hypothetical protein
VSTFVVGIRNTILDWLTGKASPPAAANRFITVFSGDPQAGGVEVIALLTGSSTRPNATAAMGLALGGVAVNTAPITVVAAAVAGGMVNYAALYDAATGGNLMGSSPVAQRELVATDSLTIPAGALSVGMQ